MTLRTVPTRYADAKAFINAHHRHLQAPPAHIFSIGIAQDDELVGVAMVGRPVARTYDDGFTLEVSRTAVADGIRNGNSMLYGACWRATKALGYRRLITYTEAGETGASLRAAGWRLIAERPPRNGWDMPSRRRPNPGRPYVQRMLWEAP